MNTAKQASDGQINQQLNTYEENPIEDISKVVSEKILAEMMAEWQHPNYQSYHENVKKALKDLDQVKEQARGLNEEKTSLLGELAAVRVLIDDLHRTDLLKNLQSKTCLTKRITSIDIEISEIKGWLPLLEAKFAAAKSEAGGQFSKIVADVRIKYSENFQKLIAEADRIIDSFDFARSRFIKASGLDSKDFQPPQNFDLKRVSHVLRRIVNYAD